jgi:hypothetical protein
MDEMPGCSLYEDSTDTNHQQQAHFQHQRTPGQILSLTSNIEFSPYLSYLTDSAGATSPDLIAAAQLKIKRATTHNQHHHQRDDEFDEQKQLMLKASDLVNKSTHHNQNCRHVCKYRSRADKVPPMHHHHHFGQQQHQTLKRVNQDAFAANLNSKKTNASNVTNLSFNDSLAAAMNKNHNNSSSVACRHHHHRHLLDSTALGNNKPHYSSITGGLSSASNKSHNVSSSASDVLCQRRLTPLRWSKKMSRRRKSIFKNLSALNPTSRSSNSAAAACGILKPLLKGKCNQTLIDNKNNF